MAPEITAEPIRWRRIHRGRLRLLVAATLVTGTLGPGAGHQLGAARAGEALTFSIFVAGLDVGRAAIAVGKRGMLHGSPALRARGLAEVTARLWPIRPFDQQLTSTLAAGDLQPLRSTLRSRRGSRHKVISTDHARQARGITRQKILTNGKPRDRSRRLPSGHYDLLGALLSVRKENLRRGWHRELTVLVGTKVYRVSLRVMGDETVTLRGDPRAATRLRGSIRRVDDAGRPRRNSPPRELVLWFSANQARVPLQARLGTALGTVQIRLTGRS